MVLCIRVKLKEGKKLAVKDIVSSDPYCKVWVGGKGMIEPPERGLYYSTVCESTVNPVWGKTKWSGMTKALFKEVGAGVMLPEKEPVQDSWTFLWKEGQVIHVQIWDKDQGSSDDYMGNVSFVPDITKQGPQTVTEKVHNGPPGQRRCKEKVSGTITIEWEWASRADQLNVDQWIPVLQQLCLGDDRALSFLRQEDLLPHCSLPVARYLLGQIAKGNVTLPPVSGSIRSDLSSSYYRSTKRQPAVAGTAQDWEQEFADDDDDDDVREPDGIIFLSLGSKVLTFEFFDNDTIGDIKERLAGVGLVSSAALKFTDLSGGAVPDVEEASLYASLTLRVATTESTVEEIAAKVEATSLAAVTPPPVVAASASFSGSPASSSSSGPSPLAILASTPAGAKSLKCGIITQLAVDLFNQDFDAMTALLTSLPMDQLVTVSPILVACTSPAILDLIRTKCAASEPFATRVRMIQNGRTQFSHLDPIIGTHPLSAFLDAFLAPDFSFEQGQVFPIRSVHPLTNEPISEVKVVKIFSSLARPSILAYSNEGAPVLPGTLFKRGEDLYNETCLQVLFQMMNELWEELIPAELRPRIFGLRELPGNNDRGFLEIVADVRDLEIVERGNMELIRYENDDTFIRTTCGWVLAAYFLGLSDRHRENTLVRITDGSAIPIDFGFILGNQPPSYNTFCITISGDMYKYLLRKEKWVFFCQMFLAGFWAVRTRAHEFIRLVTHLFSGTDRNLQTSAEFVSYRMLIGKDVSSAMKTVYGNLRHAPICFYTKKKIEGHAKKKKIPARDDFIGSLARKIGASAARPEKAEKKTGQHFHPGKVDLHLPLQYPAHFPGDLVAVLTALAR